MNPISEENQSLAVPSRANNPVRNSCRNIITRTILAPIVVALGVLSMTRRESGAAVIQQGWDLFSTTAGTSVAGIPLTGVPMVDWNFERGYAGSPPAGIPTLGSFGRNFTTTY